MDLCLAISLLLFAGTIVAALIACGWGYEYGRVSHSCCAQCGYPVEGLGPDSRCPECGGDLGGAGTRSAGARMQKRPPRWLAALTRSIIALGLGFIAFALAGQFYPRLVSTATVRADSPAGLYRSLHIRGVGSRDLTQAQRRSDANVQIVRPRTVATLHGPAHRVTLTVLDAACRAEYDDPDGGRTRTLDALSDADVLEWLRASGVNTARQEAAGEAAGIRVLIASVVAGGGDQYWGTGGKVVRGVSRATVQSSRATYPERAPLALVVLGTLWLWARWLRQVARAGPGMTTRASPTSGRAVNS